MLLGASTSGLLAGAAGIGVVFVSHQRVRRYLFRAALAVLLIGGAVAALQWDSISALQFLLGQRIGSTVRYGTASNWFEEIVFRMEVFDTSAAMFLAANPWYLLVGTGPGLVSIPATPFMPVTPYTSMYVAPGLNSPPTMGLWLELANGGLAALMLWAGSVLAGAQSLTWIATHDEAHRRSWTVARWSFVGAATIYLLAAGFLSSLWPLFLGVAMGSAFIRHGRAVEPAAVPAT